MLEVKNATVKMEQQTLFSGLSFSVDDGQMVCLTGGSGCGKTTLLRAMLGFVPLEEGHICIDGEPLTVASAEEFRKYMSYVPQDLAFPCEWVHEMVKMPFGLAVNRGKTFSKDKMMKEWGKLGIDESLYDKRLRELSGGQRQRIAVAVCGMLGKAIVLADEPTSALDERSADLVADYFRQMASKGASVVMVSHQERMAKACDKTISLDGCGYDN